MAKNTPAAAPPAEDEAPAPLPPAAPPAPRAPAAAVLGLDECCALMSARDGGVLDAKGRPPGKALLAAFNHTEERAGRLFDTEAAYRARLAAFAAAPAV